jgi:hydroxymethylpyrimidine/phosphomethylpyrimidine kinase
MGRSLPCALAIGGLDPGGGAGVIADLRAFAAAGAFGAAAVALVTVQSTGGLRSTRALSSRLVAAQAREVIEQQRVRAVKVGALGTLDNVRGVSALLDEFDALPVVIDTPMRPTRGEARLLAPAAIAVLRDTLVPRATVLTVNLAEARALLGNAVLTLDDARGAALALARLGPGAALVKGGHLSGRMAIDVLAIDNRVIELRSPRLDLGSMHGTGCTLASLIAGRLARCRVRPVGSGAIIAAVRWAKRVHHAALSRAVDVGGPARVIVFESRRIGQVM